MVGGLAVTKRMQGRIGPLLLVAATAALLAGCDP